MKLIDTFPSYDPDLKLIIIFSNFRYDMLVTSTEGIQLINKMIYLKDKDIAFSGNLHSKYAS